MNKVKYLSLLVLLGIVGCSTGAIIRKTATPHSSTEIAACIRDPNCHERFIVAHRGLGFGAPENSREAVRRAVAAGVPIIEIDVRKSLDGELYILHDATLDLSNVFLKNGETIPTLAEIYNIARGYAILYLDIKSGAVQETADWIARNGSWDDVIFCVNGEGEIAEAAHAKSQYPLMIVATQAYSSKDLVLIQRLFPQLPEIIDIGFPTPRKSVWLPQGQKIYASSLVLEIGLLFLKPFWPLYINAWGFDLLETNYPLFWLSQHQ